MHTVAPRPDSSTHCPLCRAPIGTGEGLCCATCQALQHAVCVREFGPCHPAPRGRPTLELSVLAPSLARGSSARLRARQGRAREERLSASLQGVLLGLTFCTWLSLVPQSYAAHGLGGALGLILASTLACFAAAGLAGGLVLGVTHPPFDGHRVELARDRGGFLACCLRWLALATLGVLLSLGCAL
ncbi:MAG: hypothetical protein R3F62_26865 [Planctomycetota bacterium]